MRIFDNITKTEYSTGVALGFFDGVHLGHKAVISQCVATSVANGCVPCVFTFNSSPSAVLSNKPTSYLTDNNRKFSLIGDCGIDSVYCVDFNNIKNLSADEFVREILVNKLNAKYVFCGYNYHFGAGGTAGSDDLRNLCGQYGVECFVSDKIVKSDMDVSSTAIRNLIANGDIEKANTLLGYDFSFCCDITRGNSIGKKIDTPTINQPIPSGLVLPKFGVYASRVTVDGTSYNGATNIGTHPTVGECAPVCETYLFDYSGADLYAKNAIVNLCKFIRPEQKFDNLSALQSQISKDKQNILSYFNKIHLHM